MHKSKRSAWPIQHRVYTDHQPLQSIFKKDLTLAPKFLQRILLLLQRYDLTVVYRKRFSLAFSRHRMHDMLSWTPPQRPSSISLASNYAMPHHHALATALTPQRFAKNSALKMLFFLILLGPSSLPLSDQVC